MRSNPVLDTDWQDFTVGELAEVKTGPFGSALHASDYKLVGTPIITVEHLGERRITRVNLPLVGDFDSRRLSAYQLLAGDIVFSRVGSIDRCALVTTDEAGWLFSGRLLRLRGKSQFYNPELLIQIFKTPYFLNQVRAIAVGQTMPSLNTKILNGIRVRVPTRLSEQNSIAAALADVDSLVDALDELIAKKRGIRQGVMQQLLTGKMRLRGFSGEWQSTDLGDLVVFLKGFGLPKSVLDSSQGHPCIHYGELFTSYGVKIEETLSRTHGKNVKILANPNDVLMPTSDVTPTGLAVASAVGSYGIGIGGDILIIRPKSDSLFGPFLANVIRFSKNQVLSLVAGSTVYHIYASQMKKFRLVIPSLAEQIAIAEVLSDMDAEIDAVVARREKTALIKTGMMQELLTARTRLL